MPLDPTAAYDGPSEYCWGKGLFPPGIADNEGQTRQQQDFGEELPFNPIGDRRDQYARLVADKRTDSIDPESDRDFESLGNPDRFGGQPPLIREQPQPNTPAADSPRIQAPQVRWEPTPLERKW
jgi:hypothetical protein